jgi:hypothetical protein
MYVLYDQLDTLSEYDSQEKVETCQSSSVLIVKTL